MKFALCVAALLSVAVAVPNQQASHDKIKRQNIQNSVPLSQAAMTDPQGNVIQFDAAGVYLDMKAKGL